MFFLLLFSYPVKTSASDVNFSQAILPVRFVYLDQDSIKKIFNTVTSLDGAYTVKFISGKEEKEITPTERNLTDYQNYVCRRNFEFSGLTNGFNYFSNNKSELIDFKIDFVSDGNILQEIHTLV